MTVRLSSCRTIDLSDKRSDPYSFIWLPVWWWMIFEISPNTYKDVYTYFHVETYLMHFFGKIWGINIGLRSIVMQLKIRIFQDFFIMMTNMHLIYVNTARGHVLQVDSISCPEGGGDRNMHQLCFLKIQVDWMDPFGLTAKWLPSSWGIKYQYVNYDIIWLVIWHHFIIWKKYTTIINTPIQSQWIKITTWNSFLFITLYSVCSLEA